MNKFLKAPLLLLFSAAFLSSCDKDDPELENQEELITTVTLTFTPAGGGTPVTATWQDRDGAGGQDPTVSPNTILNQGTTYNMTVEVLDESGTQTEDITEEIRDEDEEHQFFFSTSGLSGMQITYTDQDANQKPIGLSNTVVTPSVAATGTLTVILRHEPNKDASGVASGDITNAGGETDIETAFPITIQ